MSDLPVNVDATYDDQSPGDALHQQHHDTLHALWNELKGTTAVSAALRAKLDDYFLLLAGGTMTGDLAVPDETYGVGWDGSLEVPTKNAVYDKIETIGGGGGAMEVISRTVLAVDAASISFTSIAGTYESLLLTLLGRGDLAVTTTSLGMQFNGDTAGNYDAQHTRSANTTLSGAADMAATSTYIGRLVGASAAAGKATVLDVLIPGYARTVFHKATVAKNGAFYNTATSNTFHETVAGLWRSTAAITRVDIIPASGNLLTGTVATLYGIKGT